MEAGRTGHRAQNERAAEKKPPPTREQAEEAFKAIMNGVASEAGKSNLDLFPTEETFRLCAELDSIVTVHSGVWGRFRET